MKWKIEQSPAGVIDHTPVQHAAHVPVSSAARPVQHHAAAPMRSPNTQLEADMKWVQDSLHRARGGGPPVQMAQFPAVPGMASSPPGMGSPYEPAYRAPHVQQPPYAAPGAYSGQPTYPTTEQSVYSAPTARPVAAAGYYQETGGVAQQYGGAPSGYYSTAQHQLGSSGPTVAAGGGAPSYVSPAAAAQQVHINLPPAAEIGIATPPPPPPPLRVTGHPTMINTANEARSAAARSPRRPPSPSAMDIREELDQQRAKLSPRSAAPRAVPQNAAALSSASVPEDSTNRCFHIASYSTYS